MSIPQSYQSTMVKLRYRKVDGDDVAEPLPVVEEGGEVGDGHDEQGRNVHRHHLAQDHTAQLKLYHHSPGCIT